MDELQARHRKEQRDLQSRVTQKKKQASKKTRKGVNDECDRLEQELKHRQTAEIAALSGHGDAVTFSDHDVSQRLEELMLETDGESEVSASVNGSVDMGNGQSATNHEAPVEGEEAEGSQHGSVGRKPNRAKARLARRAAEQEELAKQGAEEAKNLPDQKTQERDRMVSYMKERNLVEKEINADGHCLYSAVADQLDQLQIPVGCTSGGRPVFGYRAVRAKAAEYIQQHGEDFLPFLEEPLDSYVQKVRDTAEWGGQMELLALAKSYGVEINVLQDFGRVEKIEPEKVEEGKSIWLGYYKHGFGLGEHYNSLRKAP